MKNELRDSHLLADTAVAGRRTAGNLCGSKEVEWWMATMTTMATVAKMAAMATVAKMAAMTSMDTKLKGLVSMMCWDMTILGKWLCLLTISAPKVNFPEVRDGWTKLMASTS